MNTMFYLVDVSPSLLRTKKKKAVIVVHIPLLRRLPALEKHLFRHNISVIS